MPIVKVTPTISTGAYTSGDVIGGAMTFKSVLANRGILSHISIFDADAEGVQFDLFLFDAALSGAYTDNAAFAIDSADEDKYIGTITIATSDYVAAGSGAKVGTKRQLAFILDRGASGGGDLIIVAVIRSATTFTATNDLRWSVGWMYEY